MINQRVLIIAAHPDDEVLGCGATISKLKRLGAEVMVCILSNGESSRVKPNTHARHKALKRACDFLKVDHLKVFNFPDNKFDSVPMLDIVQSLEGLSRDFNPNIIYTHGPYDLNIDHQLSYQATLTAFRALPTSSLTRLLAYEVLSTSDAAYSALRPFFVPNYFEEVSQQDVHNKLQAMSFYQTELHAAPHPRSLKSIEALLTLRGSSVGVMHAEAFYVEKIISRESSQGQHE